jgi:hypothetical protein
MMNQRFVIEWNHSRPLDLLEKKTIVQQVPVNNMKKKYGILLKLSCNSLKVNKLQNNSTRAAKANVTYGFMPKSFDLRPLQ